MSERLARAGAVTLVGASFGSAMGLVLSLVVGRTLGDDGAGVFYASVAVFTIAANVLELGADTGLVRMLARYRALDRRDELARTVLAAVLPVVLLGAAVLAVAWLLWPWAAGSVEPAVADAVRTVLPLALAASLLAVVLGGTRGLGSVLPFTVLWNVALPAVRPVLVGLAVVLGLDAAGAVQLWAWPVVPALAVAGWVLHRQLRRTAPATQLAPGRREVGATTREFWAFSGPRGLSAALEILLSWLDVVLVALLRSPAEAGVYAIVSRSVTAGLVVEAAARVAVSPRISASLAVGDTGGAARLLAAATGAMVLLSWPFYLTLAAFGPAVLGLFGPSFRDGAPSLVVLSGAMMLLVSAGTIQTVLLMGGRSSWQLANKAVALVVLVGGNLLLVPVLGITGAALAWAAAIVVDTALAVVQVHRGLGVPVLWRRQLLPAGLAVAVFGVSGAVVSHVAGADLGGLALHLAVAGPAYAAVCWLLRQRLGVAGALRR